MIVAYYIPHNDGVEFGLLKEPGDNTGSTLVDLYEVDGEIRAFATEEQANEWLDRHRDNEDALDDFDDEDNN